MNDNKKFWQRYAKFYSRFVSTADKSYMEICNKIEPYINKENNVLELACGSGQFSLRLAHKAGAWDATDFSENMIKEAEAAAKKQGMPANLTFSVKDATKLPYKDNSYDVVLIANALHIMPQPELALAEIKRVLKPGGIMLAPTFVHGEGAGVTFRTKLIELFGFKAYLKPTAGGFGEFIKENGFGVISNEVVGSRISPMCCMVAGK